MTYWDFLDYVKKTKEDVDYPIVKQYNAGDSDFYKYCVGICKVPEDEKEHFLNHVNVKIKKLYEKDKDPGTCFLCNCILREICTHEYHYYCCYGCNFSQGNVLEKDEDFKNWMKNKHINFNSNEVDCKQEKLVAWVLAAVCGCDDEVIREVNKKHPSTRAKIIRSMLRDSLSSNT